jgi:hypothetical protein
MQTNTPISILIVQGKVSDFAGGELYTFEIAKKLFQRGHHVFIYTQEIGLLGNNLEKIGVKLFTQLDKIPQPDIIHGHQLMRTAEVLDFFPTTASIFVCHNNTGNVTLPPNSKRIVQVFGVSQLCVERLRNYGIEESRLDLLENFVDTNRFQQRPALPQIPTQAAVFSNYATWDGYLPAIKAACEAEGISLEVLGSGVGNNHPQPELVLPHFDLVFAKARAALEAMAIGNAVILCDFAGLGEMVTSQNYDRLKPLNFGFSALAQPHDVEIIRTEIRKYNPLESAKVTDRIRRESTLEAYIIRLEEIYFHAIRYPMMPDKKRLFTWQFRMISFLLAKWAVVPEAKRSQLKRLFKYPFLIAQQFLENQLLTRKTKQ